MKNDFNRIAPAYDFLSKTIFGKAIRNSQTAYLDKIVKEERILIVGGGTGKILLDLDQLGLELNVFYVELSVTMLKKSKALAPFNNLNVEFICADALHTNLPVCDIVITNFFLDVFIEQNLNDIMKELDKVLRPNGIWLCSDFVLNSRFFQDTFIKFMYLFFRVTTNLEGRRLQNFERYFNKAGFQKISSRTFFHGMIVSACYSRS